MNVPMQQPSAATIQESGTLVLQFCLFAVSAATAAHTALGQPSHQCYYAVRVPTPGYLYRQHHKLAVRCQQISHNTAHMVLCLLELHFYLNAASQTAETASSMLCQTLCQL
jgi:hypothetical protein